MAVYAEWLSTDNASKKRCSNCNKTIVLHPDDNTNFCLNCGAIMNKNIVVPKNKNFIHCKDCYHCEFEYLSPKISLFKCVKKKNRIEYVEPLWHCDKAKPKRYLQNLHRR